MKFKVAVAIIKERDLKSTLDALQKVFSGVMFYCRELIIQRNYALACFFFFFFFFFYCSLNKKIQVLKVSSDIAFLLKIPPFLLHWKIDLAIQAETFLRESNRALKNPDIILNNNYFYKFEDNFD